ncbi:MAG: hypothetical protein FWE22_05830 [Firmicutes bacterium]|nr:hypothetical protein [Bacillota bacterium]
MDERVIGKRTGFGLKGSAILSVLMTVGLIIGAVLIFILMENNSFWRIPLFAGLLAASIVAILGSIWGIYNLIIGPPKNLIVLSNEKLFVYPRKNKKHILELNEIIRVTDKIHATGFADQYYGKIIIETKNEHITVPFVSKHRKVAQEIRSLLR